MFAKFLAVGAASGSAGGRRPPLQSQTGWITDVDGIKVGHLTDSRRPTGCTVVFHENGLIGGVDVRGAAPATRETDALSPLNVVDKIQGIVLSGGSAFGLDTATGVMRWMEEHGKGFPFGGSFVPVVPAAAVFDLSVGDAKIRPDADAGYKACHAAKSGAVEEGTIGAGAGCTVGKAGGGKPMKGGIGTSSIKLPNGLVIGAIVAVNCAGDVIDPKTGKIVAAGRTPDGKGFVSAIDAYKSGRGLVRPGENSTIGIVATNAALSKSEMTKIAQMAHDGLARCINPIHTMVDGDTIFAISTATSTVRANLSAIGALAAEAISDAVLRGVMKAKSVPGFPSYQEIKV